MTEQEILDLVDGERQARTWAGYPQYIIDSTEAEVREALRTDSEFVGRIGGLTWTPAEGWQ